MAKKKASKKSVAKVKMPPKKYTNLLNKSGTHLSPFDLDGPAETYPVSDITRFLGYDLFKPKPGAKKSYICRVCNAKMDVKRNYYAPKTMFDAMANKSFRFDYFTCHFSGQPWHNLLIRLKDEVKKTSSISLAELVEKDIDTIMSYQKNTIEQYQPTDVNHTE